jgi:hypothetical protein
MNVTLALDEELVRKAREVAQARGTTLNQLIRDQLRLVVGNSDAEETIRRLHESYARGLGDSGGRKIRREDAYEGRLK